MREKERKSLKYILPHEELPDNLKKELDEENEKLNEAIYKIRENKYGM